MSIFRNRTTDEERTTTTAETRAEAAEAEAREAERVEARERAVTPRRDVVAEPRPHPIAATRATFGGIDIPASLVGMLTALAMTVLLAGIVGAAVGAVGYQTGLSGEEVEDITVASLIGGLVVLFFAYVIGGWAAGRIARYDGARNGLMAAVWTILLAAVLSGLAAWLGDEYDVLRDVNMPQWFDRDAVTAGAIFSGAIAIVTMLFAGFLGGLWGARYHRRADETLLDAHTPEPPYGP